LDVEAAAGADRGVAVSEAVATAPNSAAAAVVFISDAPAVPTDDTMDVPLVPASDDTVTLDEQTWTSKIKAGIDAAIAGLSARLVRTPGPVATRQPSTRKR